MRLQTAGVVSSRVTLMTYTSTDCPFFPQRLDRRRYLLCLLNHSVKLPIQSSVESCAGDDLLPRPNQLVLARILVLRRRRGGHVLMFRGGTLALGQTSQRPEWALSPG